MAEVLERAQPWAFTLVAHNWPVLMYSIAAIVSAVLAYRAPSRPRILFLYGTILLILGFEYEKHAVATIVETTSYLFSVEKNPWMRSWSQWLLVSAAPDVLHALGVAAMATSVLLRESVLRRRRRARRGVLLEL